MSATLTTTETTETETTARTNVRRIDWPRGYAELTLTAPRGRDEAKRWQALVRVDFAKIRGGRASLPKPLRRVPTRAASDHGAAVARFADVIARTAAGEAYDYGRQIGRALMPGWIITATDGYAAILAPGAGREGQPPRYAEGAPLAPVTADGWQAYAKVRSLGARRPVAWRWTPERLTFTATDADGDEVSAWAPLAAGAGADGAITLGDGYLAPLMGPTWHAALATHERPGTIPALVLTAPAGDVRVVIVGCR